MKTKQISILKMGSPINWIDNQIQVIIYSVIQLTVYEAELKARKAKTGARFC